MKSNLQAGIVMRRHVDNICGRSLPSSDEDQPEDDTDSTTDPDSVDPLTLPDLPTDPELLLESLREVLLPPRPISTQ